VSVVWSRYNVASGSNIAARRFCSESSNGRSHSGAISSNHKQLYYRIFLKDRKQKYPKIGDADQVPSFY
ncbi:hypothetical protein L9F63_017081, partial [Diploptera punctata]